MSAVLICGSVAFLPVVMGGRGFASVTVLFGVGHVPTIFTTPGNDTVIFVPFSRLPVALAAPIVWPPSPSALVGVGHVVARYSATTFGNCF